MRQIKLARGVLDEVIDVRDLTVGCWYYGIGRFIGCMALWDGKVFHGFQNKFGQYLETTAVYGAAGFDPITKLDTEA
jgi:hypothetical protein